MSRFRARAAPGCQGQEEMSESSLEGFLEAGALAEFGEPADLLKDKTGLFTKLVEQSGKKNSEHLIGLSNAAKERRQSAKNLRDVQEAAEEAHHEGSP